MQGNPKQRWILDPMLWIVNSRCEFRISGPGLRISYHWNLGFLILILSRIPQAKSYRILESALPCTGRYSLFKH